MHSCHVFNFFRCFGGVVSKKNYLCLERLKIVKVMAKAKFGMIVTDMRNKLGGHVFSKNRGGSYVRTKVTPSNPQTTAQSAVRSALGSISAAWSGLTAGQRAGFNAAVDDWKTTDIFGDLKSPSGKNLFTRLNLNLDNSAQPLIDAVPDKVDVPSMQLIAAEMDLSAEEIVFDSTAVPVGTVAIVYATPPLTAGTSYAKNRFRIIALNNAGAVQPGDLYTGYVAKFGIPVAGSNIQLRVKVVASNGQAGVPETVKMTVVA